MDENKTIVSFSINPSLDINAAVDALEPVKKISTCIPVPKYSILLIAGLS
ncbi:MAG: hypothetical protein V2J08_03840 [Desulfotignum sp.]|jgi:hypothetical protein|nr:hypothetical protein [Desulfotignum sp.]